MDSLILIMAVYTLVALFMTFRYSRYTVGIIKKQDEYINKLTCHFEQLIDYYSEINEKIDNMEKKK